KGWGSGVVTNWTDTLIGVRVPDASGVVANPMATVTVVRSTDGAQSNPATFGFLPVLESHYLYVANDFLVTQPGDMKGSHDDVVHGAQNPGQMNLLFSGSQNDDVILPRTSLINTWTLDWARVYPNATGNGSAAVTESTPGGASLWTKVHWSYDVFSY